MTPQHQHSKSLPLGGRLGEGRPLIAVCFIALLLLLTLLAACHPGRHARMQAELARLQARNQADSLLTDDSLAQALALYFDNHGTPNEQMEAHYLLGRTYADRGEAPAAIAAYHDAIDRADTTAADCNYSQLWRVYSQMADVFYYQNLIDDQARCLNQSVNYAFKAGDSIMALNQYAQKMAVYIRKQEHDSTIAVFYNVYEKFTELGYENIASRYFSGAFGSMLEKKDYLSPMRFMEKYERLSGYFDAIGNIEAGREIYYYYKGLYYLDTQQYDSAQFYFRKELKDGKDFNNQNAASRGLALLYQQIHMPDSATKYAIYSYDMNDSVYARMATAEVENAHNMYNSTFASPHVPCESVFCQCRGRPRASPMPQQGHYASAIVVDICPCGQSGWHGACPYIRRFPSLLKLSKSEKSVVKKNFRNLNV